MSEFQVGALQKPNYVDRKIDELVGWVDNPRNRDDASFERLIKQMKQLGVYKPLLINQDNIVLGGNMRLEALKKLGVTEVSCSLIKTDNGAQMMDYALSDNDQIGVTDEAKIIEYARLHPIHTELFAINSSPMKLVDSVIAKANAEPSNKEVDSEGLLHNTVECPRCNFEFEPPKV